MNDVTQEWQEYEQGKAYNRKLDLYVTVDKNERMFAGDQWKGVVSNGLPTPVFNIFKQAINYFIAAILSQAIKMQYSPETISDDTQNPNEIPIKQAAEVLTSYSDVLWENLKMPQKLRQVLLDGALSGDLAGYIWWNTEIDTGQEAQGDIDLDVIDNVNVLFGNPNDVRVQKQPYIIISFRDMVSNLRKEAEANGISPNDIQRITGDSDYQEQSGDRAKIELDTTGDNGKTTAIIKLWRNPQTGTIWFNKATKGVVIRKDVDSRLKKYPVPWGNWDNRKNSYHGQAIGTGLIPNQIFINKMFAMVMLNLMHTAFPKPVYNSSVIELWDTQIGKAIPVNSDQDIRTVATYLQPGEMSAQVMNVIDAAIKYTKDLIGASDSALGNVKPENTSAIIAVSQQAAIPLENIKANLYQWVEDVGYIWFDYMANYYGRRKIPITVNGKRQIIEFDFDQLKNMRMKLKVDVGPSSYWSEITAMQTLDNLLKVEKINFIQYLERVPDGLIPKKQELIEQIEQQEQMAAQQPQQPKDVPNISIKFETLPATVQAQILQSIGIQANPQDFVSQVSQPLQQQINANPGQLSPEEQQTIFNAQP